MKILMVNNFYSNVGGVETYISSLADLLKKFSHEVYFFAVDKKPYIDEKIEYTHFFPAYKEFASMGLKDLPEFLTNPFYFYNFEAKIKLDKFLKEIKPDIVHLNSISRYLSPSVIASCKKYKIPIVMTLHDGFFACPDVALLIKSETYCKDALCKKGNILPCVINKCNDKSLLKSVVSASEFFFRKIHKLYDKVDVFICPSRAIYDLALSSGIKKEKLNLVPNFIDESYFNIASSEENKGYFLYVGRLEPVKGLNFLLEAMKNLPEINLKIVGTGSEEDNLKELARKLELTNVEFLGFKTGEELEKCYLDSIATIIPSIYLEAFGLTVIESFAYSKPVIGSKIGGIGEIIQNGVNGKLFEVANIEQLTTAIKDMYVNQDETKKMAKSAKGSIHKYNSASYYKQLDTIYKKLTGEKINL